MLNTLFHELLFILLFPFVLVAVHALVVFVRYKKYAAHTLPHFFILKSLGLYLFGVVCTIPAALHQNQDNFQLFWHAPAAAFLDEYLKDNFSSFLLIFPILLMLVYLIELLLPHYKIQTKHTHSRNIIREFFLCISSFVFFAPAVFLMAFFNPLESYKVYTPWASMGVGYFALSIVMILIAHEIYHYALHRFMHTNKWMYRHVHHIHHLSINPTVFSSYAFHPIEAMLHPMVFVLVPFIFPVSYEAMIVSLLIAEFFNIMGHHGCEWFPERIAKLPILKYVNRATFHNMHHSHGGRNNYSYYTTILDRAFGTFNPASEDYFVKVVAKRKQ